MTLCGLEKRGKGAGLKKVLDILINILGAEVISVVNCWELGREWTLGVTCALGIGSSREKNRLHQTTMRDFW